MNFSNHQQVHQVQRLVYHKATKDWICNASDSELSAFEKLLKTVPPVGVPTIKFVADCFQNPFMRKQLPQGLTNRLHLMVISTLAMLGF